MATNNRALVAHVLLLFAQLLFHAAPPFPAKNKAHITFIIALVVLTHLVGPVSDNSAEMQPYTLLWPIWLGTIEKCITAGSQSTEQHYWRTNRSTQEAISMTPFAPLKLGWALGLLFNWRLIGWNHQARNVPLPRSGGKRRFFLSQTIKFVKLLFVTDLVLQLSIRLFWTAEDGSSYADSKNLSIAGGGWVGSLVKVAVFGAGPYFFMHMQYVAISVVAVLTGLSEPDDWPPLFGSIAEATTVRNFWGTFWHQSVRRPLTTISNTLLDALQIRRRSTFRSYAFIFLAFSISGLSHAQSMALLPRPSNITLSESTLGILCFFVWQAGAIAIEDFTIWAWKSFGMRPEQLGRVRFVMGYLWVMISMWLSLPWAADVMMRLRLTEKSFLPATVWGRLVGKLPQ